MSSGSQAPAALVDLTSTDFTGCHLPAELAALPDGEKCSVAHSTMVEHGHPRNPK